MKNKLQYKMDKIQRLEEQIGHFDWNEEEHLHQEDEIAE